MAEADNAAEAAKDTAGMEGSDVVMKLMSAMLAGRIVDVKPQLDFTTELGFTYPVAERTLDVTSKELAPVLESLAEKGILRKDFFDRLLRCSMCRSVNLRPSIHCPKCGSGDVVRGRVLEHFACKYTGVEEEFAERGKYICPRCKMELRTIDVDYQSRGILRKCRDCGDIFSVPLMKWRCLKCSSLSDEDKVGEENLHSYSIDETKRNWLTFELQSKAQFMKILKEQGYEVTENARMKGRSGAEHSIAMLATRDDGIVTHTIAIGVEVARTQIGLDRILDFDVKAYDSGIQDKMLIIVPGLGEEAKKFAELQRIVVLEPGDLEKALAGGPQPTRETVEGPFQFKSKSQLIQYLEKQGYDVTENAEVKGRSGAIHNMDILATRDEGIITHRIAIGIRVNDKPMGLDKVFDFDDRAYDAGILKKVFVAVPGLTREARQFAQRQRIRVFEVEQLESPAQES